MTAKTITMLAVFLLCFSGAAVAGRVVYGQAQQPVVGFIHDSYTVREDDGEVLIPIRINKSPQRRQAVVVEFSTEPGTAEAGSDGDYLQSSTVLTFTHQSDTIQFGYVTIINDDRPGEADETVNLILRLLTPDTGKLGRSEATLIIVDDDKAAFNEKAYVQPVLAEEVSTPPFPVTSTPPPPPTEPAPP